MPAFVQPFSQRVLRRLAAATSEESDPWLRDDLQIAHRTVLHAALGDAVECSTHVLASYEILGVHPEKVWPAICARREARGGPWYVGAPPKKPAQSVQLWCEKTNGVEGCIFHTVSQRFSANRRESMSATASTYRKPPRSTSENPLGSPHQLVPRAEASDLHPRDRIVLLAMLQSNAFAVIGSRNFLYPSTQTVAVILGLPYITVRRAINRLEARGVLHLERGSNWIDPESGRLCRPCTYQVNPDKLQPRLTLAEHRRMRFGRRKGAKPVPISPSPQTPAPANPEPPGKVASMQDAPVQTELTERQRSRLRRRTQTIINNWKRSAEASAGTGAGGLSFMDVVRQACDDEFIEFDLAWPWLQKLWWRNEHGWRQAANLEEGGET